jgi:hypothetical protein
MTTRERESWCIIYDQQIAGHLLSSSSNIITHGRSLQQMNRIAIIAIVALTSWLHPFLILLYLM